MENHRTMSSCFTRALTSSRNLFRMHFQKSICTPFSVLITLSKLHRASLCVYAYMLWPPHPYCVASVSHRVSHGSAWLTGSASPEWQPAGVCSPVSVRSPEPLRTLPLQVSSCCPSARCPSSVDGSCKDKMGSHGRHSPLSFGCGLTVVLIQLLASLFLLELSHSPEIV